MSMRKGQLGCCNCDGPCLGCWEEESSGYGRRKRVTMREGEIRTFDDLCDAMIKALRDQDSMTRKEAFEEVKRLRQRACDIACDPSQETDKRRMIEEMNWAISFSAFVLEEEDARKVQG